eukprot:COSAG06_NODE_6871_length_2735_cov_2.515554_1_plen_360_part_10
MQAYSFTLDDPVWSVQLLMESERSADFVNEGTEYELSFTSGFAELEIPGFGAEGALFAVRWRGVVFVEHPGEYEFLLLSDVSGHTALDIDGERVVENNGATASGVRLRRLIVPVLDGVDECVDQPLGWVSNDGTPCSSYETMGFCTPTGAYGSAWTSGYGTFADYAVNGVDASQACCVCGGGSTGPSSDVSASVNEVTYITPECAADGDLECSFEATLTNTDAFEHEMSAYFRASEDGPHTFQISASSYAHLWVSPASEEYSPEAPTTEAVASVPLGGGSALRQWDRYAAQTADSIDLVAGSYYFIRAVSHRAVANRGGLLFEAYDGVDPAFGWRDLASVADTALDEVWNGWTPYLTSQG